MNSKSKILHLTIPTQYAVGPVNIYAIKGSEGYYLIDAGIATDEARNLIKEWLPYPLAGILLTHGHPDHLGIAGELAREYGIPVYFFPAEYKRYQEPESEIMIMQQIMIMAGVDSEVIDEVTKIYQKTRRDFYLQLANVKVKPLIPGLSFPTELGDLKVIYTPGHTIGHCCFYLPDQKYLFSGDHVLASITPNPVLDLGINGKRRLAYVEYLESLQVVASLKVERIFPSHGRSFSNLNQVLGQLHKYHSKRERVILSRLSASPQTPFQITQKVYPEVKRYNIFLALSKVWGHLDLLELEGKVKVKTRNGFVYYK